jgi:hypothetical protein
MDKIKLPEMLKKLHLNLLLLCSLIGFGSAAQTYPIAVNTQITQPSPIYLRSYADATTINSPIKVQLVLNDLTISNRQVKLKIYFQGNTVSFTTNDFVVGARPLYLEGGFPLQLTNVDLAPYFEYQNLLGITQDQYAYPLAEGVYNIYVEVYDFATGKKLSKKTGAATIIFHNKPPFLNLPSNNASIMQQNIQNIIFSWTPGSVNVSNVEYEFSLVEIWDQYTPVQNAFAYSPPLYTTTTRNTTLQYGINEPQLIPGKKYAWRVKAKAILGAEEIGVFLNNGYSEIYSFTYEVFCTSPLAIKTDGISQDQAKISWSGNIDNYDYQVNYREKNADSEWYKLITPRESLTISNLKPNTVYEYTVGASCDVGKYTHSTVKEFTTLAKDEIAFAGCGIEPDPKDLANKNPLPELFPNDVVTAGDFPIVVLHSTGSNGTFTGDGYVTLPFLEKFRKLIDAADALGGEKINIGQFSRIRITFNNIGINTDFKLISGEIIASYDPEWKSMGDLDGIVKDVFGDAGEVINHDVQFVIEKVVKNEDGSITVFGPNDVKFKIDKTPNDIIITDKNGAQYAVPANAGAGKIEKTGQLAPGGIPTPKNTNGMGSGGNVAEISSPDVNVIFSKGDGKYAFDTPPTATNGSLNKTYQTIPQKSGGTYKVNYKAISDSPNSTDVVVATVDFKNGKTKKDLVFKTQNGTAIDSTQIVWKDNVATLTLKKTLDFAKETIIATVKPATPKDPKEAAGKYDIAGTIDLWHLTNKKVNVTLVSVNNAKIPSDVQQELNRIYEPSGVSFNVNTIDVTIADSWGTSIETGDSDLFNTYTPEQQEITTNLKAELGSSYKNDTYYIIYTGASSSKPNTLGFMPLKRQYAFIFNDDSKERTVAHELGHGIFGLIHPSVTYGIPENSGFLMDKSSDSDGIILTHNDWQTIHAPGLQLYPFIQGDTAGELAGGYGLTPDFKFITAGKSNIVSTKVGLVSEGHLSGFLDSNKIKYIWNKDKNAYTVNGENTGTLYSVTPKSKLDDGDVVWLVYNYSDDCNEIKYIHTTYKEISSIITKIDKVKAQKELDAYIKRIDLITKEKDPKIYSALLGCGESGNGNGNTKGLFVKNLIKGEVKKEVLDKLEALMSGNSKNWITGETHQIKGRILLTSETEKPDRVVYKDNSFYVDNIKEEIKADEIVFWMEYNSEGKIRVKQIISGSSFDQSISTALKSWGSQIDWKQKTLFEKVIAIGYESVDGYFTAYYDLFDFLSKNIDKAKIPADVYDCTSEKYKPIYAEVFSYINFLSAVQDELLVKISASYPQFKDLKGTPSQIQFALFCGMYNGLVDVVKSVPDLAKLLVSSFSEKGRTNNSEFIASISEKKIFLEQADGSKKLAFDVGITFPKIWYLLSETISNQFSTSEPCKTAEFVGSVIGPVIVMCFGDEIAGEGIASKIFSSTLKAINLCGKITDPFHYLGLSYNFIKPLTGKLAVIGENAAGDVIRQIKDNLFRVKLISEGKEIVADITGEELQSLVTKSAKGEITELLVEGSKKAVRILSNTTPIMKDFVYQTKKLTVGLTMVLSIGSTDVASAALKQGTNTIEYVISETGEIVLTDAVKTIIPKIETAAKTELENAITSSIKTTANATAKEGKIVFLAGVDNGYDAIAFKIGNILNYKIIKQAINATDRAIVYNYDNTKHENDDKCPFCPDTYKLNSETCNKLTLLGKNTSNKEAVEKLCQRGISLAVLNKVLGYSTAQQKTFVDDFSEISTVGMEIMNKDLNLVTYWKENGDHYKTRKYHDGKHTNWADNVAALRVSDKRLVDPIDHQIDPLIQDRTTVNARLKDSLNITIKGTFDGQIMGSGYSNTGKVYLTYNREKYIGDKDFKFDDASYNSFMQTEDPYIQNIAKYLDFIRLDLDRGKGGIYKKLYGGSVEETKLNAANRPGIHSEVLILNEIIKGKNVKSANDVKNLNIKIIVKQKLKASEILNQVDSNYNHMCTCPNCFYLTEGVNFILNK